MGSHFFLQGIFPTLGSNPGLLHCRQILYQLSYQEAPKKVELKVAQSFLTLYDAMDYTVHGILYFNPGYLHTVDPGEEGLIPGSGRSRGGGNGNPLQYSCLENAMDREAWQATVDRVTKSQA